DSGGISSASLLKLSRSDSSNPSWTASCGGCNSASLIQPETSSAGGCSGSLTGTCESSMESAARSQSGSSSERPVVEASGSDAAIPSSTSGEVSTTFSKNGAGSWMVSVPLTDSSKDSGSATGS